MATVDLVASEVMDISAALMNNPSRTVYSYTAQLPYLQLASQELQEMFELASIPVSENSSVAITILAGQTEIVFNASSTPKLPDDLIEPKQLWERPAGIDPYISMSKRDFIPHNFAGMPIAQFTIWVWQDQKIKLPAATVDIDVKIDYVKTLFPAIVDENSLINVINARTFLQYRTAGLLSEFIERNQPSADKFNAYADGALERSMGIGIKGKQAIQTRRRPFRAGWKSRRVITR